MKIKIEKVGGTERGKHMGGWKELNTKGREGGREGGGAYTWG